MSYDDIKLLQNVLSFMHKEQTPTAENSHDNKANIDNNKKSSLSSVVINNDTPIYCNDSVENLEKKTALNSQATTDYLSSPGSSETNINSENGLISFPIIAAGLTGVAALFGCYMALKTRNVATYDLEHTQVLFPQFSDNANSNRNNCDINEIIANYKKVYREENSNNRKKPKILFVNVSDEHIKEFITVAANLAGSYEVVPHKMTLYSNAGDSLSNGLFSSAAGNFSSGGSEYGNSISADTSGDCKNVNINRGEENCWSCYIADCRKRVLEVHSRLVCERNDLSINNNHDTKSIDKSFLPCITEVFVPIINGRPPDSFDSPELVLSKSKGASLTFFHCAALTTDGKNSHIFTNTVTGRVTGKSLDELIKRKEQNKSTPCNGIHYNNKDYNYENDLSNEEENVRIKDNNNLNSCYSSITYEDIFEPVINTYRPDYLFSTSVMKIRDKRHLKFPNFLHIFPPMVYFSDVMKFIFNGEKIDEGQNENLIDTEQFKHDPSLIRSSKLFFFKSFFSKLSSLKQYFGSNINSRLGMINDLFYKNISTSFLYQSHTMTEENSAFPLFSPRIHVYMKVALFLQYSHQRDPKNFFFYQWFSYQLKRFHHFILNNLKIYRIKNNFDKNVSSDEVNNLYYNNANQSVIFKDNSNYLKELEAAWMLRRDLYLNAHFKGIFENVIIVEDFYSDEYIYKLFGGYNDIKIESLMILLKDDDSKTSSNKCLINFPMTSSMITTSHCDFFCQYKLFASGHLDAFGCKNVVNTGTKNNDSHMYIENILNIPNSISDDNGVIKAKVNNHDTDMQYDSSIKQNLDKKHHEKYNFKIMTRITYNTVGSLQDCLGALLEQSRLLMLQAAKIQHINLRLILDINNIDSGLYYISPKRMVEATHHLVNDIVNTTSKYNRVEKWNSSKKKENVINGKTNISKPYDENESKECIFENFNIYNLDNKSNSHPILRTRGLCPLTDNFASDYKWCSPSQFIEGILTVQISLPFSLSSLIDIVINADNIKTTDKKTDIVPSNELNFNNNDNRFDDIDKTKIDGISDCTVKLIKELFMLTAKFDCHCEMHCNFDNLLKQKVQQVQNTSNTLKVISRATNSQKKSSIHATSSFYNKMFLNITNEISFRVNNIFENDVSEIRGVKKNNFLISSISFFYSMKRFSVGLFSIIDQLSELEEKITQICNEYSNIFPKEINVEGTNPNLTSYSPVANVSSINKKDKLSNNMRQKYSLKKNFFLIPPPLFRYNLYSTNFKSLKKTDF